MQTYDEPAYAAERLVGTIVRANNKAVKINSILGDRTVEFNYLSVNKRDMIKLDKLDITPVPLGYCNYNGAVSYLSRSPVRQDWKQGLRSRTLRSSNPNWMPDEIPFKVIGRTIDGEYPQLDKVFEHLGDNVISMAWCRNFCVDKNLDIYYKGIADPIGVFLDRKERRFKLNDNFQWVLESLEEVVNA